MNKSVPQYGPTRFNIVPLRDPAVRWSAIASCIPVWPSTTTLRCARYTVPLCLPTSRPCATLHYALAGSHPPRPQ